MKYFYFFLLFCSIGCNSEKIEDKKALGNKKYGGVFTFLSAERTTIFFPLSVTSVYDQRILTQIFEPLFKINNKGAIVNHLAKSYKEKLNGRVIRITIRKNVTFHSDACFSGSGKDLTAGDVKFSLDFACSGNKLNTMGDVFKDKIVGAEDYYLKSNKKYDGKGVSGIKVLNDSTIQISLKDDFVNFKKLLAHPSIAIFSKKAYEFYQEDLVHHPIGTGPFQLRTYTNSKLVLERNPNYWKADCFGNKLPFLREINVLYSKNINEEYNSFSKKRADIIFELPIEILDNAFGTLSDAQNGKNLLHRVVLIKGAKINYLSFDCSSLPFNDYRVRKAFSMAIDRKKICLDVLNGEGNYAITGVIPKSSYYIPPEKTELKFDPIEARRLMAEAGYNEISKFPQLTFFINTQKGSQVDKWTKAIIHQLKQNLGVKLRIKYGTLSEKYKAIENNNTKIWKSSWVPDYPDAEAYLRIFYGNKSKKSNASNHYNNFNNSLFDYNFKLSQLSQNDERRLELQRTCDEILLKEAAVAPIFSEDLFVIVNLRVRDFNINRSGIIDFSKIYIKEVY